MKKLTTLAAIAITASLALPALAQDSSGGVFYIGAGVQNDTDSVTSSNTPFSLGIYAKPADRQVLFGFDYGREGQMLDSTGGGDSIRLANSYNLLVGGTVIDGAAMSFDAMFLVGLRESVSDCPDSFIGFQCYANQDPTTEYDINFGAVFTTTFDDFAVGVRATTESTQLTLGLSF